jgi:hypothetical protein
MQKSKTTPKLFFLHILSMVTLYASAISLIVLVFQIININIPDTLVNNYYNKPDYQQTLRGAISWLVVMFPVYLGSTLTLSKLYIKNNSLKNLAIRKWLVYLTLFVATCIIMGSLIAVINRFLDGELTLRFFSKLGTVLLVAGSIFGYYFLDIKKDK